eukprot:s1149_g13.t1
MCPRTLEQRKHSWWTPVGALKKRAGQRVPGEHCWIRGFQWAFCCDDSFGPEGNKDCWDETHNYSSWFAVLSLPMLGITHIPDMPQMDFIPSIMHLLQIHPHLSPEECKQLNPSVYELRHFHDQPKGISSSVINMAKAMPTATHSWGTQLLACHCGCRDRGFSAARIASKGLYAVLIPLGTMVKSGSDWFHGMRHPHPKEAAIINGLDPRYLDLSEPFALKFLLSGVGQMASPLHGAWLFSNMYFQMMKQGFPLAVQPPRHVLANLCQELLKARSATWPHVVRIRSTVLFERELTKVDHPLTTLHQDHVDPYVASQLTHIPDQGEMTMTTDQRPNENPSGCLEGSSGFVRESTPTVKYDVELDMPASCELLQALEPTVIIQDFPVEIHRACEAGVSQFCNTSEAGMQFMQHPKAFEAGDHCVLHPVEAGHIRTSEAGLGMLGLASQAGNIRECQHPLASEAEPDGSRAFEAGVGFPTITSEAGNIRRCDQPNVSEAGIGSGLHPLVGNCIRASEAGVGIPFSTHDEHANHNAKHPSMHTSDVSTPCRAIEDNLIHDNTRIVAHDETTSSTDEKNCNAHVPVVSQRTSQATMPDGQHSLCVATSDLPAIDISAGTARSVHATLFAQQQPSPGDSIPQVEPMTTKPDPLTLADPWMKAKHEAHSQRQLHGQVAVLNQVYNDRGGIHQFANRKRVASPEPNHPVKKQHHMHSSEPPPQEESEAHVQPPAKVTNQANVDFAKVWIGIPQQCLTQVRAPADTTVGQLAVAEGHLVKLPDPIRPVSAMGSHIPMYSLIQDNQIVFLEDGANDHKPQYPELGHLNRQDALCSALGH